MKREFIILIAALVMGAAAVVVNEIRIKGIRKEQEAKISNKVSVVGVVEAVGTQTFLSEEMLVEQKIPQAFMHPLSVEWKDRNVILGQRLRYPLRANQQILWSDMTETSRRSIGDSILPGRGVVTIPIDIVGGVSGLISPGSRVDIIGIFKKMPEEPSDSQATKLKPSANMSLAEINKLVSNAAKLSAKSKSSSKKGFHVMPVARNLGVFAVGTRTQMDAQSGGARGGYSTISFDVPRKVQVLLVMAMHKVEEEGGRLICILRSSDGGGEEGLEDDRPYRSTDFQKLIKSAQTE